MKINKQCYKSIYIHKVNTKKKNCIALKLRTCVHKRIKRQAPEKILAIWQNLYTEY